MGDEEHLSVEKHFMSLFCNDKTDHEDYSINENIFSYCSTYNSTPTEQPTATAMPIISNKTEQNNEIFETFKKTQKREKNLVFATVNLEMETTLQKVEEQRKYKFDSMLKKVKVWTIHFIRDKINEAIKSTGLTLELLPQSFQGQINNSKDKAALSMTLKELWTTKYSFESKCKTNVNKAMSNEEKWKTNVNTIEHIADLPNVRRFLNRTFEDLVNEFLNSNEYKELLEKLKNDEDKKSGNGEFYRRCFKQVAQSYINYFNEGKVYKKRLVQQFEGKH